MIDPLNFIFSLWLSLSMDIHGYSLDISNGIHTYPNTSLVAPSRGFSTLFILKERPARARARARLPMDTPWLSLSMDIHKERLGGVLESGAPTWAPLFQRGSSPGPNFKKAFFSLWAIPLTLTYDRNQASQIILHPMIDPLKLPRYPVSYTHLTLPTKRIV